VSRTRAELAVAACGALTFGALLASFMAFRPVRDALVLDGNPDQIPWLFMATFSVVSLVTPIWGTLVAKRPRRIVPLAFHVFAACALVFFVVLRAHVAPVTVGRVFYVWSAVFNVFVVSVFWSLLADLLGPHTAKRLYGPIAAGGTIGAIAGPALTTLLLDDIGVAGVLVMTAVLLELAVLGVVMVRRLGARLHVHDPADAQTDEPLHESAFEGLRRVARSPYLAAIGGFVICTTIAGTFLYLAQADIVKQAIPERHDRTAFFALLDLRTNAVTLILQLVLAPTLLAVLGPGIVLCVLPLAQGIGIGALVAAPALTTLVIVQVIGRSVTHGLTRPARELLFTVVSRDDKYRAKNVIDTFVFRLGDMGSAWLYRGLVAASASGLAIGITAVPLTGIWLSLAVGLGVGFRRRIASHPTAVPASQESS
jgi:ATP:ADP antiporter, AAA family